MLLGLVFIQNSTQSLGQDVRLYPEDPLGISRGSPGYIQAKTALPQARRSHRRRRLPAEREAWRLIPVEAASEMMATSCEGIGRERE